MGIYVAKASVMKELLMDKFADVRRLFLRFL
jgi:hypothetical protein